MNKRYYIGSFLALILLCTACIKESTEDCFTGLKLNFDFSLHTGQPGNLFGSNVRVIRVYCFDERGILRHIQEDSGTILTNDYVMDVALEPGKYTVISWGGSRDDLFNSYHEAGRVDAAAPTKEVKIGETTLSQFRMIMNSIPASAIPEETQMMPTENQMDDLYYGAVGVRNTQTSVYQLELIEVKTGIVTQRRIELIRDTNILKITVSGIEHLGAIQPQNFRLWTLTDNGEYQFDNAIADHTPTIRYTPYRSTPSPTTILADIKLMRLDMERHKAQPILLYIEAPDGHRFPAKPIDIVNTLLLARNPETNEFIYHSQSDFDKIYEHPIEVRIGSDLSVRIYIGEWEIVYVKPD